MDRRQIAAILDIMVDKCYECPLEYACSEVRASCLEVWENFLETKLESGYFKEWEDR